MKQNPYSAYQGSYRPMTMQNHYNFNTRMQEQSEGRQLTAEETFRRAVLDVKSEKEKERAAQGQTDAKSMAKCQLHPKTPSNSCRTCRKIKDQAQGIKKDDAISAESKLKEILSNNNNNNNSSNNNQMIPEEQSNFQNNNNNNMMVNTNAPMQIWELTTTTKSMEDIIKEICSKATHAEPWTSGQSENQIQELIDYTTSGYVRIIGFLLLRYICDPAKLWKWFSKYIMDEEEVHPCLDKNIAMSIGEFLENLLLEQSYYGTILPRIPTIIDRELKKKALMISEKRTRKRENMKRIDEFEKGLKVMAIAQEDDEWHEATIVRAEKTKVRVYFTEITINKSADQRLADLDREFQGQAVFNGGIEALIDLGEILTPSESKQHLSKHSNEESKGKKREDSVDNRRRKRSKSRSHSRQKKKRRSYSRSHSRGSDDRKRKRKHKKEKKKKHKYSRSRSYSSRSSSSDDYHRRRRSNSHGKKKKDKKKKRNHSKSRSQERKPAQIDKYMEKVRQMQTAGATASSKSDYAARPISYKTSLSTNLPAFRRGHEYDESPEKDIIKVTNEKPKDNDQAKVKQADEAKQRYNKLKEKYSNKNEDQ